jgi:CRISPR-associated endonuclease Csy4
MNVYIDITLIPGSDIGRYFLWEKVYKQIHLRLADIKMPNGLSAIGIAFPEYDTEQHELGVKLRLFAQDNDILENFNAKKCLKNLTDYTHITSIRSIPSKIKGYVRYKRQQFKSNTERLARRKARREEIKFEQALEQLKDRKESFTKAPYIRTSSISSGQNFRIFILKEQISEQIQDGFNCYGLSATSTVPDF